MKNNTASKGPILVKLSTFKSSPKWSIQRPSTATASRGPGKVDPPLYNANSCVDKTSKYASIASPCTFGKASRFSSKSRDFRDNNTQPGPGNYSPPPDFSHAPYSTTTITFGHATKSGSRPRSSPSPTMYDIRGMHRTNGTTFDARSVHLNARNGWYYDSAVKSVKDVPAPGAYHPHYANEKTDRRFTFGVGDRPSLSIPNSRGLPSPGRYNLKSTLGGRSFSFTTTSATFGSIHTRSKESNVGPICGQPTQFG